MSSIYSKRFGVGSGSDEAVISAVVPDGVVWVLVDLVGATSVDTAVLQLTVAGTTVWQEQVRVQSPLTEAAVHWSGRQVANAGETVTVVALGAWSAALSGYELQAPYLTSVEAELQLGAS